MLKATYDYCLINSDICYITQYLCQSDIMNQLEYELIPSKTLSKISIKIPHSSSLSSSLFVLFSKKESKALCDGQTQQTQPQG